MGMVVPIAVPPKTKVRSLQEASSPGVTWTYTASEKKSFERNVGHLLLRDAHSYYINARIAQRSKGPFGNTNETPFI